MLPDVSYADFADGLGLTGITVRRARPAPSRVGAGVRRRPGLPSSTCTATRRCRRSPRTPTLDEAVSMVESVLGGDPTGGAHGGAGREGEAAGAPARPRRMSAAYGGIPDVPWPRPNRASRPPTPASRSRATSTRSPSGPAGPILLQDHYLIEQMAQFNRERIPERQPHAKGGGAFGHFEVTERRQRLHQGRGVPAGHAHRHGWSGSPPWPASAAAPTPGATRAASR